MYRVGDRVVEIASGIGGRVVDIIYDYLKVHFDNGEITLISTDKVI